VSIEPPLIGGERANQERAANDGDNDLDRYTRRPMFGPARWINSR
jgi:hypothetical protein